MCKTIKEKAQSLFLKYNTRNIYDLCDCLSIKIFRNELGNIKGFFQNELDCKMIHLNNNLDEHEEKVVLAHEIGHAILHKELNICFLQNYTFSVKNKYENQANKFAAELLVSDDDLNDCIRDFGNLSIEQISKQFNVPESFIEYKFF